MSVSAGVIVSVIVPPGFAGLSPVWLKSQQASTKADHGPIPEIRRKWQKITEGPRPGGRDPSGGQFRCDEVSSGGVVCGDRRRGGRLDPHGFHVRATVLVRDRDPAHLQRGPVGNLRVEHGTPPVHVLFTNIAPSPL